MNAKPQIIVPKPRIFISLYYDKDRKYKKELADFNKKYCKTLFDDESVGEDEIDDTGMTDEVVRRLIRKDYIKESSVFVLLCGEKTKTRKFVDWEIQAAMTDDPDNPNNKKCGILVLNLPNLKNGSRAPCENEKSIIENGTKLEWHANKTRSDFERDYPYLPSRIIDSLAKCGSDIAIVDYSLVINSPNNLLALIDNAYSRRETIKYDTSAPLMGRNSTGQ